MFVVEVKTTSGVMTGKVWFGCLLLRWLRLPRRLTCHHSLPSAYQSFSFLRVIALFHGAGGRLKMLVKL